METMGPQLPIQGGVKDRTLTHLPVAVIERELASIAYSEVARPTRFECPQCAVSVCAAVARMKP